MPVESKRSAFELEALLFFIGIGFRVHGVGGNVKFGMVQPAVPY